MSLRQLSKLHFVHISDSALKYRIDTNEKITLKKLLEPANKALPPKPKRKHPWFKEKRAIAEGD